MIYIDYIIFYNNTFYFIFEQFFLLTLNSQLSTESKIKKSQE